ncbi:hypothetical protein PQR62_02535 [Herbaspirillum lusitanum]|jgi:hypothetical protein|uniref:PXPV repeat-containing protein n=1 Tax=Herbaspirillum lusitanum TaxID=213312 RepID=A0ABW9A554_9BURK
MASKKIVSAVLVTLLASGITTSAFAGDRYHGGGGGNGVAIAAGIIGAVAIGSLIANANSAPQPVYQAPPQPVYYQQPQQVYYEAPQRVYYEQPRYAPPPPRYVERGYEVRQVYRYDDGYYRR